MARGWRRRGPLSPVGSCLLTVGGVIALLVAGAGALYLAIRIHPAGPTPAEIAAAVPIERLPPPPDIHTRLEGGMWLAWVVDRPQCTAEGRTEAEARVNVGLAAQLAMRVECQPGPNGTNDRTGPGAELPPRGWYPDPRHERGDMGARFGDGQRWTTEIMDARVLNAPSGGPGVDPAESWMREHPNG